MKKLTSLLIGCSLGLAGFVMAQQPVEQQQAQEQSPAPTKEHAGKKHAAEGAATGAQQQAPAGHHHQQAVSQEQNVQPAPHAGHHAGKAQNVSEQPSGQPDVNATASPTGREARKQARQERRAGKNAKTAAPTTGAAAAETGAATGAAAGAGAATGAAAGAGTSPAPSVGPNNQQNVQTGQANATGGGKKKLDTQKVQQIKQQHASFKAQPRPDRAPAVTFNQSYRIENSERWQGPRYEVFRSYRPQWHDEGWYHQHYTRVELIGGGYYFFNNGYWFPAWGYSPSAQYYAYDGPIYVGHRAVPPDQVIADVQAALQDMGYYTGEVDGLLGPLTRQALTAYQSENGLTVTAVIDEPTLESLQMG